MRYEAIEHDAEWWLRDRSTGREQPCDTEADARWFASELNSPCDEGEPPNQAWSADDDWDPETVAREIQSRRIATRDRLLAALGG